MDRRATFKPCTSGTPAPSNVPSIRQKRAIANCATSGPTSGARKIIPSQMRLPFRRRKPIARNSRSDANDRRRRTSKPYERTTWLAPMMICVINGSAAAASPLKIV